MSTHLIQPTSYSNAPELSGPTAIWEPVAPSSAERVPQVVRATHSHPMIRIGTANAPTLPQISERFSASLTLSSILGFCGISIIAHGSAIDSMVAILFGAAGLVTAAIIQWRERRRALRALIDRARSHGVSEGIARTEAKAILRKWLL